MDYQLRLQGAQRSRVVAAVHRGAGGEDPRKCAAVRGPRKGFELKSGMKRMEGKGLPKSSKLLELIFYVNTTPVIYNTEFL